MTPQQIALLEAVAKGRKWYIDQTIQEAVDALLVYYQVYQKLAARLTAAEQRLFELRQVLDKGWGVE